MILWYSHIVNIIIFWKINFYSKSLREDILGVELHIKSSSKHRGILIYHYLQRFMQHVETKMGRRYVYEYEIPLEFNYSTFSKYDILAPPPNSLSNNKFTNLIHFSSALKNDIFWRNQTFQKAFNIICKISGMLCKMKILYQLIGIYASEIRRTS